MVGWRTGFGLKILFLFFELHSAFEKSELLAKK